MEEFNDRRRFKSPASFSIPKEYPMEPWHSTPVKKNLFSAAEAPEFSSSSRRDESRARPALLSLQELSSPASSCSLTQDSQRSSGKGPDSSTVQRQRLELQLLMAELKDRDRELNATAAAHHKHLLSWEQERQRVLILEQRCVRLEDELQKRGEVIRALSKRLKAVEARERDALRALDGARTQLQELSRRQMNTSRHEQELEERNQSMNTTLLLLSNQVGQLQVREEELVSMLKLKDKDVIEATNHILDLSGRVCELEKTLEDLRTRESKALQETEEQRQRFRESRHHNTQLRAELQEKTSENNSQREELIRLKQEIQLLQREAEDMELQMRNEDKSWRDELLELSRSKQSRVESELLCLRQVCENQQNDLQLLKLNLESAREALRHHEGQRSRDRADSGLGGSHELESSGRPDSELETGLLSEASVLAQEACGGGSDDRCSTRAAPHRSRADLDLMAVFNYDTETGTPVCVVDISPALSCAADLNRLQLDRCSPSHGSRRSSVCLHDSALSIELCGSEEGCSSSTGRLQRLLAESQEMVASLENSAKKSVSLTNCDADGHVQSNHSNDSHAHTPTRDQEGGECDSQSTARDDIGNEDASDGSGRPFVLGK